MRPIFHWKPERIKAPVAICYITFSTLRHLQYRIALRQKVSVDFILSEPLNVQSSIHMHKITKDLYKIPGRFSNAAKKTYKALDLEGVLKSRNFFQSTILQWPSQLLQVQNGWVSH